MKILSQLIWRETSLLYKGESSPIISILFIFGIFTLFSLNEEIHKGFLIFSAWLILIFSMLFCVRNLIQEDKDQGITKLLILNQVEPFYVLLSKILSLWIGLCLPLVFSLSIIFYTFYVDLDLVLFNLPMLAIGSLGLSSLAILGALMGSCLSSGIILLPAITFPLYLPIVVISNAAVYSFGLSIGSMSYLGIISCISLIYLLFALTAGSFLFKEILE